MDELFTQRITATAKNVEAVNKFKRVDRWIKYQETKSFFDAVQHCSVFYQEEISCLTLMQFSVLVYHYYLMLAMQNIK